MEPAEHNFLMHLYDPRLRGRDSWVDHAQSAWWRLLRRLGTGRFDPTALENWDPAFIAATLPYFRVLPYLPAPARIRHRIGKSIRLRAKAGQAADPKDQARIRDRIENAVQKRVDQLVEERMHPH
jgi:hypothetical protein